MRAFLLSIALLCGAAAAAADPVVFQDTIAQRTLACTACHGKEGRAGPDGYYPRIAGKPLGYLYAQLLNFRDGRRHYGLMAGLLEPLSDDYLFEIARYFSGLDLPYPPPPPADAPPEVLQRGRVLALQGDPDRRLPACIDCHGQALTGVRPAVPGLLGLPRDYLNAQLGAWRTGQRRAFAPDCMAEVARRLSPQELAAVTAWLASQALPRDPHPVAAPEPLPKRPLECGAAPLPVRESAR